jgi:hypothetical protein
MGRIVIAVYRPKPGQTDALSALLRDHVPFLRRLGLATARTPVLMRAADGTFLEVFEWASPAAIEQAHSHPEVLALWDRFAAVCDYDAVANVPECQQPFGEFEPV